MYKYSFRLYSSDILRFENTKIFDFVSLCILVLFYCFVKEVGKEMSAAKSITYSKEELRSDAALYLKHTMGKLNMWNRDFEFDSSDESLSETASKLSEHAKCLRSLHFSKCCLEIERSRWGYIATSTTAVDISTTGDISACTADSNSSPFGVKYGSSQRQPVSIGQFIKSLPQTVNVIDRISASTIKDAAIKQIKKDVERDSFIINGTPVSGAKLGLDGVSQMISDFIVKLLDSLSLQIIPEPDLSRICIEILRTASRTNSGGIVLDVLNELLDMSNTSVVPNSKLSSAADIEISVDQINSNSCLRSNGGHRVAAFDNQYTRSLEPMLGLRIDIFCSTVFSTGADSDEPVDVIGTYQCELGIIGLVLQQQLNLDTAANIDTTPATVTCSKIKEYSIFSMIK